MYSLSLLILYGFLLLQSTSFTMIEQIFDLNKYICNCFQIVNGSQDYQSSTPNVVNGGQWRKCQTFWFQSLLLFVFHKFQSDHCQALSWRQYSHSLCELNACCSCSFFGKSTQLSGPRCLCKHIFYLICMEFCVFWSDLVFMYLYFSPNLLCLAHSLLVDTHHPLVLDAAHICLQKNVLRICIYYLYNFHLVFGMGSSAAHTSCIKIHCGLFT